MKYRTSVLLGTAAALALAPAPLAAQSLELGGWVARSFSSESTHGIAPCASADPARCRSGSAPSDGRSGTAGALSLRWQRPDGLGARGEVALVPKGYAAPEHPYVSSLYLEMPLLAEVSSEPAGPFSFFLAGGVAPAYLLRCTVSSTTESGFHQAGCDEAGLSALSGTRRFDLGGVYSGGVRMRTGSGSAYLEVRSVGGLIDTRPAHDGRTLNSTSAVMAGFTLIAPWLR
jgi:hypothetical protein